MSPTYAIQVSNISPESTQTKLDQFFSFCGRISNITLTPGSDGTQSATIYFEKESAAKTALLLNEGTLDGAHLHVTSESLSTASSTNGDEPSIGQEDKPKAGIIAEYIAHGYVLSDTIVERAIEADKKQGISSRFLQFIHDLDAKAGEKVVGPEKTISGKAHDVIDPLVAQAVGKAKEVDQHRGITTKANDYYSKAFSTPFGKKVLDFYTNVSKEVVDVHTEARRIADEKKTASAGTSGSATVSAAASSSPASGPTGTGPVSDSVPSTGAPVNLQGGAVPFGSGEGAPPS